MNVSKEADAAFMAELKRTDRARYENLIRNMEREARRLRQVSRQIKMAEVIEMAPPLCEYCGLKLPPDKRVDGRYCDTTCKKAAYRARRA